MPEKAIAPRISEASAKWIAENFKTLNAGSTYILEAFPGLYARTIHDLKGKFSHGELCLMVDVMNGTWLTAGIAGQHLDLNVHDGIDLDHLDQKWGIDGSALNTKLEALSIFQVACLEIWIGAFWEGEYDKKGALEKWVKQLAEEGK